MLFWSLTQQLQSKEQQQENCDIGVLFICVVYLLLNPNYSLAGHTS